MQIKIIEGKLSNNNYKFAIIASRFNEFIVSHLINGAIDILKKHEVSEQHIEIIRTPGAFEIPKIAKLVAKTKRVDGIICLGALIRGDTLHFDLLAHEVTKGLAQIDMEENVPISFGILTTDTIEQAIERAGAKNGNKGNEAAIACLEMISLCNSL
ncbi:MAG: 6,7-dimethyl-8-ribityllumazine synthase [Gammaproteobacteria bacterium]|nr:6,7-dimethyl-8-ribityllumazine synthase [Gammaproteobacteria bacterium]